MTGRSGRSGFLGLFSFPAMAMRVWRHRRAVGRLGALDDRLLADIGLTRGDVQAVLAEPLMRDPSEVLARGVRNKRAARAATAREAQRWARDEEARAREAISPREATADAPRRAA